MSALTISEAMALTSNSTEALVLQKISYWYERATYRDGDGVKWLIHTATEFQERSKLKLSKSTIWRTLRRLAAKGLIELSKGCHRFWTQVARPHCNYIRLMVGETKVGKAPTFKEAGCPLSPVANEDPTMSTAADAEDFVCEDGMEGENAPAAPITSKSPAPVDKAGPLTVFMASVAETVAALANTPLPRADLKKTLTAAGVHAEIRHWHKQAWPAEQPPESSGMRIKWLKTFLARMRAANCTDAQILAIIEKVCLSWESFRVFTKERTGWQIKEIRPAHMVFMQQCAEMVNFMAAGEIEAAKPVLTAEEEEAEWEAKYGAKWKGGA